MGIRDLFRKSTKDTVIGTKVLVAFLDLKFAELASADHASYLQSYSATTVKVAERFEDLRDELRNGYDVVHLFCDVRLRETFRIEKDVRRLLYG